MPRTNRSASHVRWLALAVLAGCTRAAAPDESPSGREADQDASRPAMDGSAHGDGRAGHDAPPRPGNDAAEDAGPRRACPDNSAPAGKLCLTDKECGAREVCAGYRVSQKKPCGSCHGSGGKLCKQDMDCAADQICLEVETDCTDHCELNWNCRPRCTSTSCAASELCQPDGRCGPRPCTAGFTCAPGWSCAPPYTRGADEHGCKRLPCNAGGLCWSNGECQPDKITETDTGCRQRTCARDADCDCGYCSSDGTCADFGSCQPETPY